MHLPFLSCTRKTITFKERSSANYTKPSLRCCTCNGNYIIFSMFCIASIVLCELILSHTCSFVPGEHTFLVAAPLSPLCQLQQGFLNWASVFSWLLAKLHLAASLKQSRAAAG